MAKKEVIGIHLVCRNALNVEDLGDGRFKTGNWKIHEKRANTGKYIALHNYRKDLSYMQGVIERWEPSEERPGRLVFYVKSTDNSRKWEGRGTGEKGFLWSEE